MLTVLDPDGEPIEGDPFDFSSYFVGLRIDRDVDLAAELTFVEEVDEMTVTYVATAEPATIGEIQQAGDGPVELRSVTVEHPGLDIDVALDRAPQHEWFRCRDGDATYRFSGPVDAEFRRVNGETVSRSCEL